MQHDPIEYDDTSWHYGGDFPKDLPGDAAAATHIGMFLTWLINADLTSESLDRRAGEELQAVRDRRMTGAEFLLAKCDGKLGNRDLDIVGNAFACAYYQDQQGTGYGAYIDDYEEILLGGAASIYYVADNWNNYDRIALAISRRYEAWNANAA